MAKNWHTILEAYSESHNFFKKSAHVSTYVVYHVGTKVRSTYRVMSVLGSLSTCIDRSNLISGIRYLLIFLVICKRVQIEVRRDLQS